jgi:hypothetical protein
LLASTIRIETAPGEQLEVVLRTNGGLLDTTVLDDRQTPLSGITVVLVPSPPLRGRLDLYRTGTTSASGAVRIQGIAPGEYKVFAWDGIPTGSWLDPDVIRLYENQGRSVRFDAEGRNTLTLIPIRL